MNKRPRGIRFNATFRDDAFAIVHPGVSPDDKAWRVSWFDDEGPVGHTSRETQAEAIHAAVGDGYSLLVSAR